MVASRVGKEIPKNHFARNFGVILGGSLVLRHIQIVPMDVDVDGLSPLRA